MLIPAALFEAILAYGGPGGLNRFWRDHPQRCRRIAVDDPDVVRDLDTPEQYEK